MGRPSHAPLRERGWSASKSNGKTSLASRLCTSVVKRPIALWRSTCEASARIDERSAQAWRLSNRLAGISCRSSGSLSSEAEQTDASAILPQRSRTLAWRRPGTSRRVEGKPVGRRKRRHPIPRALHSSRLDRTRRSSSDLPRLRHTLSKSRGISQLSPRALPCSMR